MTLSDFVESNVSISNASSPTVQGLNTGLIAAYHTNYPDRVRVYAVASILASLVTDGFSTDSPTYKAAEAYAAAPNAPALMAVGRRANAPQQTLQLQCSDGTVNDAYNFTVVGSDGVSHEIAYTNAIDLGVAIVGSALTGTVAVVAGSPDVTFSAAQTLPAGTQLVFASQATVTYTVLTATSASTTAVLSAPYTGASAPTTTIAQGGTSLVANGSTAVTFSVAQSYAKGALLTFATEPGVYYALSAAVVSSTSGTLTTAYQGPSASAAPTTVLLPVSGTFDVINGSETVASTASQVAAINPGDSVVFAAQPNATYTVFAVTASALTLSQPYSGSTASTSNAVLVSKVSTAATNIAYQLGLLSNVGTVSVVNSPAPAFPTVVQLARTDGALTDIQGWRSNGFHNIQLTDVTADPGLAADLTAMVAANSGAFYAIFLDSNSQAECEAAAEFCEATGTGGKVFFGNTSDYGNTVSTVTSDVFSVLKGLALDRTFEQQNNQQLLNYAGAATCGQALAMNPGSYTLAYKTLPLVPADSDTTLPEGAALVINTMTAAVPGPGGKNGNYYKTTAGENWLWPGCAPSGQFFDLTIGLDSLALAIQQAVAATLAGLPKVPFDDFGLKLIGTAIRNVLVLYSQAQYQFILPDGQDPARPIQVNTPTAASLTSAQRATRDVSGFSWSAGLQGAIQNAVLNGKLIP
jgi:hypothetical protein